MNRRLDLRNVKRNKRGTFLITTTETSVHTVGFFCFVSFCWCPGR